MKFVIAILGLLAISSTGVASELSQKLYSSLNVKVKNNCASNQCEPGREVLVKEVLSLDQNLIGLELTRNVLLASEWLTLLGFCIGLGILYQALAIRGRGILLINASFAFLFFGAVLIPNIIDRRNPQPGFGLGQALGFLLLSAFILGVGRGIHLIYRSKRKSP